MNLVIMGPPGSGKGTQGEILVTSRKVLHISTGDILRTAVRDATELGQKVEAVMAAGDLVPDELMMELIKDRVQRDDARNGWLLDGFPRTLPQAEGLIALLDEVGTKIDAVVAIVVPDEEILRRLGGRMTCGACGTITSRQQLKDGGSDICPACGKEAMRQRRDDKRETIQHRLDVYRDRTWPAAESLGDRYGLWKIDGVGTLEEVTRRIEGALG